MHPQVEKYLADYQEKKSKKEMEDRAQLLLALGFHAEEDKEISKEEYLSIKENITKKEKIGGVKHYYIKKEALPLEMTNEEYQAILATQPKQLNKITKENIASSSFAARFLNGITSFIWIGGALAFIIFGLQNAWDIGIAILCGFIISGLFFKCFAEFFENQHEILSELQKTNKTLNQQKKEPFL